MIIPERSRKHATRAAGFLAVSALALGVSACGGSSGGSSGGSANKTVTVKQSAPAATASSSASAPASTSASATSAAPASGGSSTAALPVYKPSTVVSKHGASTVLTSPDPVTKIGAYYKGVLAKDGWQVRSASVTAGSASFSAHRTGEGVTISVYPRASGSGISITTYPE